jgi:replicative DNA helicase
MGGNGNQFDRLPPHNIDAEVCTIASFMLDGDGAIRAELVKMLKPDAFYSADHAIYWRVLLDMHKNRKAIDPVTVKAELQSCGLYEEVGGTEYLAKLVNAVPSYAHGTHYAVIVREKSMMRALIASAHRIIADCYKPHKDNSAGQIAVEQSRAIAAIAEYGADVAIRHIADAMQDVLSGHNATEFYKCGLQEVDGLIAGFPRGGKTIVGARPGMGKSAFCKQTAVNIASDGVPVGIVSIEETQWKIAGNVMAMESGISSSRIRHRTYGAEEYKEMEAAKKRAESLPLFIVDSVRKLSAIEAAVQSLVRKHDCRVIFLDHVHIIDGETDDQSENRAMTLISQRLKWLWKELHVAGVECAQLNRSMSGDRPQLTNLRASGSLEQDGDIVLMLHREDYYHRTEPGYTDNNVLEVLVEKNKDAPTGIVPVHYDYITQRIYDLNHRTNMELI